MTRSICLAAVLFGSASAWVSAPCLSRRSTQLQMGLFDGVKEAFSAPPLEKSTISSERETPIDRWMGWSVVSENVPQQQAMAADFIDSMDSKNYIAVELQKPMGIVFEENDEDFGGIFVQALKENGIAATHAVIRPGDQLVAVDTVKVAGMVFDDALGKIIAAPGETTKLTLFRGSAKQLYGPTGASQAWLDEFVGAGSVAPTSA